MIQNNSLTGDLDQVICELPRIGIGYFEADCLPSSSFGGPEINCTCCSVCHNDDGQNETTGKSESQKACESFMDFGEGGSTLTCTCSDVADREPLNPAGQYPSVKLNCTSIVDQCLSCNEDGDICATARGVGGFFYEDIDGGYAGISTYTEFQYVTGQSEKIVFEYADDLITGTWCQFAVNDQYCNSCSYALCNDSIEAHIIDCSNIFPENSTQIAAIYNGCKAERENLGVFDAVYVYESKLSTCSVNMGGLEG